MLVGNAFHGTGPETENAGSSSFVRVLGTTYVGHAKDRRAAKTITLSRSGDRLNHVAGVGCVHCTLL